MQRHGPASALFLTLFYLVPMVSLAQADPAVEPLASCDMGQRNPAAPKELDQFGFLVGNYDVEIRRRKPDGSWAETPLETYWEGRWILGGHAIADYWYDQPPVGGSSPGRGVNVRMYRSDTKQWTNMWQHSGLNEVRTLLSEVREDGKMYMWASHPDTSDKRRLRFESKDDDHWTRFEEWTQDGGKTWVEVARIHATRAACPWRPKA